MSPELSARFRYPTEYLENSGKRCGRLAASIDGRLTEPEKDICFELYIPGPFGLGNKNIKKIPNGIERVRALVKEGIVRERTLLELATELAQDSPCKVSCPKFTEGFESITHRFKELRLFRLVTNFANIF